MPPSDQDLPISIHFHGLIGQSQETDLKQETARYLADKEAQRRLFELSNPGKKTASETFLPNESNGEKLTTQIDEELAKQAAIKAAQEKKDATPSFGEFPPPPIT
jgi:uncharacterized membrane protein YqiK